LYLMGEGRHYDTYEKLGAHVITLEGVPRRSLRGLGPQRTARQCRGRFQSLGRPRPSHARSRILRSWEIFLPELNEGAVYKYEIVARTAIFSRSKPIPTLSALNFAPIPVPSLPASITAKWTDADWIPAADKKTG